MPFMEFSFQGENFNLDWMELSLPQPKLDTREHNKSLRPLAKFV
jgi:hypothetical protein